MAGCVSGGAVVEAGSGVAAPWRRLQAAALLSQAAERGLLPLSFTSVSFPFLLLLWFSFPLFSLLSVLFFLSPFSLFRFFRSPLSLLCFFRFLLLSPVRSLLSLFPLFFLLFFSAFLASIYRGQGRCFLQLSWGAAGWSAIGRGCRGSVGGARWMVGHCVRSVGSRRENGRQNSKKKLPFFLLPRCVIGGRR